MIFFSPSVVVLNSNDPLGVFATKYSLKFDNSVSISVSPELIIWIGWLFSVLLRMNSFL